MTSGLTPELQQVAACIAAFGCGCAAVLTFLDRREAALKATITAAANARMTDLEARLLKLEGKHEQARNIAVEGIATATDEKCRERLVLIAKVLD